MPLEQLIHARRHDTATMVQVLGEDGTPARSYGYRDIAAAADALAATLPAVGRVGLLCGNSPEWIVADLALLSSGLVEIPVPLAFTADQAAGLLATAELCLVDAAGAARLEQWSAAAVLPPGCRVERLDVDGLIAAGGPRRDAPRALPDGICKIIHTSGTTSRPKGVLIRRRALDALLESLERCVEPGTFDRYVSLVPLSLLVEQVTALYMVARTGGTIVLLPPSAPLLGTEGDAARSVLPFIRAARPTVLVAPPVMIETFASELAAHPEAASVAGRSRLLFGGDAAPFVACGGAPIARETLQALDDAGIPVYEGYGLSENSSVVAWNTRAARRIGTVGRPLAHVRVRLAPDGELLVRSASLFAGYTTGDPSACALDADGWLRTGDYAEIDADGYVRILGRKKNVIITSAGRNVSPEWTEARYKTLPAVIDAVVFGDGLDVLHGLFVVDPAHDLDCAARQIDAFAATHLSEVERVQRAHLVHAGSDLYANCFTVTGRPMRDRIRELAIRNATPLHPERGHAPC